jgi:hypothetical protein
VYIGDTAVLMTRFSRGSGNPPRRAHRIIPYWAARTGFTFPLPPCIVADHGWPITTSRSTLSNERAF